MQLDVSATTRRPWMGGLYGRSCAWRRRPSSFAAATPGGSPFGKANRWVAWLHTHTVGECARLQLASCNRHVS